MKTRRSQLGAGLIEVSLLIALIALFALSSLTSIGQQTYCSLSSAAISLDEVYSTAATKKGKGKAGGDTPDNSPERGGSDTTMSISTCKPKPVN